MELPGARHGQPMRPSIQVSSTQYANAVNKMTDKLGADLNDVMREEARFFIRDVVKFTPPKSLSQGRGAIEADLFGGRQTGRYKAIGIFQRIGNSRQVPPKVKRAGESETMAVALGWEGSKTVRIWKKYWLPNATNDQMQAWHKRHQSPTTGRTVRVSQSVIGRWKTTDQMWVSNATGNRYFKWLAERVGWAKAGWNAAAKRLGYKLPSYVSRHSNAQGGYREDLGKKILMSRSITLTNAASKIPNYQRIVDAAMRARWLSFVREVQAIANGRKSRRASLAGTVYGESSE